MSLSILLPWCSKAPLHLPCLSRKFARSDCWPQRKIRHTVPWTHSVGWRQVIDPFLAPSIETLAQSQTFCAGRLRGTQVFCVLEFWRIWSGAKDQSLDSWCWLFPNQSALAAISFSAPSSMELFWQFGVPVLSTDKAHSFPANLFYLAKFAALGPRQIVGQYFSQVAKSEVRAKVSVKAGSAVQNYCPYFVWLDQNWGDS